MFFSLRDMPVESSTDCIKLVGLQIDNQLSWKPQIKYISTKISRVTYLLRNLNHWVPFNLVRSAYFAFFQSIMSSGFCFGGECCSCTLCSYSAKERSYGTYRLRQTWALLFIICLD